MVNREITRKTSKKNFFKLGEPCQGLSSVLGILTAHGPSLLPRSCLYSVGLGSASSHSLPHPAHSSWAFVASILVWGNDVAEDILVGRALQTSQYYFLRVNFKWSFRIELKSFCGHCHIALQEGHTSLFSQQLAAKTLIKLLAWVLRATR